MGGCGIAKSYCVQMLRQKSKPGLTAYKTISQIHGHAFSLHIENYIEVLIQILNEQTAIAEKSIVK